MDSISWSALHDILTAKAPWEQFFASSYGWSSHGDLGDFHPHDFLVWKDISKGLEFFRSISIVSIGNGLPCAFWLDLWIGESTLASIFPALFSHALRPHISVSAALAAASLSSLFQPRLSSVVLMDLANLHLVLSTIVLNVQVPDARVSRLDGKVLSTKSAYTADRVRSTVIIALLWNIWKHRNEKVFNNVEEDVHLPIKRCSNDVSLWANRCSKEANATLLIDWGAMLSHLATSI
ncbi:hypothetical protein BRADI_2g24971v3 [Brachypodium distachyon]|uniref:Reverse transcriptase zinc-binding domain-containing protein n=1 Tax=Brachypodium distachyon TaxID=15368 RepID=A0A2K2DAB7_BRADI|nr:hypothetical protein BRADI_2g24971v3 [Brachypodium distachyon]